MGDLGHHVHHKAAAEMRERLQGLVGPRSRGMWVSTFHSMCVRMLRADAERLGFSKSFTIYDTDDRSACIRRSWPSWTSTRSVSR